MGSRGRPAAWAVYVRPLRKILSLIQVASTNGRMLSGAAGSWTESLKFPLWVIRRHATSVIQLCIVRLARKAAMIHHSCQGPRKLLLPKEGGADMDTIIRSAPDSQTTQPRNKGKLTGAKPPLRPKHVWG